MTCQNAYIPSAYVLPRMPVTLEADMIGKASSNAEAQYGAAPGRRKVALALQGGGSHGAFLVDGVVRGGPKQARAELRRYWGAVGAIPGFGSFFVGFSGEKAAITS